MGLTEKAREYLEYKRKHDGRELFLPHENGEKDDSVLRGYAFSEYVSGEEKERENLEILRKW
jgi:hypothetical protein